VARVEACLEGYRRAIDELGAERALAFATSAARDAGNGNAFLARLAERFDLPTRLLSGDEEADLTFRGVTFGRHLGGPTIVVDLGGGSTELVLGDGRDILFARSLDVGCVRLTERFTRCDGPDAHEGEALVSYVRSELIRHVPTDPLPVRGIGVAGTVTTLATLHLGLLEEDPERLHGHRLPTGWIAAEAARFARTPVEELERRAGIAPGRAPVIAAGALALAEIAGFFELEALEVSESDVLHGVALELAAAAP